MDVPFSWSATAEDVLVVSGLLPISSTRVAGAYMSGVLSQQLGQPMTLPSFISSTIDCDAVAGQIAANGEVADCNAACLADACYAAIDERWAIGVSAGDSLDGSLGSLQIGISGPTIVNDELLPLQMAGSWLGTLKSKQHETAVMGAATGQAPPPR
jgi:hypothetical protein